MTHLGIVKRLENYYPIELRETNHYWIGKGGDKYRKAGGLLTGKAFPSDTLQLDSIQFIEET